MTFTVNGVAFESEVIENETQHYLNAADPTASARRSLATRVLFLQRARELGLTGSAGTLSRDVGKSDHSTREREDELIAQLLDVEVITPTPSEAECRRHYDTHPQQFESGELVEARHILFGVTPGTPVALLRSRAEAMLAEVRAEPELFAARASEFSNCPSGEQDGNLGQFSRGQMVPEFDKTVFGTNATGVLPTLLQTRFGFHIVLVERRLPGRRLDFESVRLSIAAYLDSRVQAQALMQYVRVLAGKATIDGVDLDAAVSPLLQ